MAYLDQVDRSDFDEEELNILLDRLRGDPAVTKAIFDRAIKKLGWVDSNGTPVPKEPS